MTYTFLFWFFCLLALLFGGGWYWWSWPNGPHGSYFFLFILIIILGLKVFGFPIHA
jgi:hypothetical protein